MNQRTGTSVSLLVCLLTMTACAQLPYEQQSGTRTQAGASQRTEAAPPEVEEYRLGPGDVVKITVYNNADLTTEAEIGQDGKISFPLIGAVKIGGLTRSEAEKAISEALGSGGFVPNAYVNMLVSQYRSRQVSVIGEVNKPGKYPIDRMASVTDLLAAAGGITPKGSNMITVIKKDPSGKTTRYQIDVKDVLGSGDLSKNVRIDSDDIIYVPPISVFYIYGEVRQPGAYPLTPDMTVRQALSLGGGLTVRGTERGIKVERKSKDGRPQTYSAQLTDVLKADDVVYVPESWF